MRFAILAIFLSVVFTGRLPAQVTLDPNVESLSVEVMPPATNVPEPAMKNAPSVSDVPDTAPVVAAPTTAESAPVEATPQETVIEISETAGPADAAAPKPAPVAPAAGAPAPPPILEPPPLPPPAPEPPRSVLKPAATVSSPAQSDAAAAEPDETATSARQFRRLQRDNARLSELLARAEIEMQEANNQRDELASQLTEATRASSDEIQKRLQRQIAEKDKEIDVLRAAAVRQQAENEASRLRQTAALEKERNERQAAANALRQKLDDLETAIKEKENLLKARGNDDYLKQIAELKAANERQVSAAKALKEKCDELDKDRALLVEALDTKDKQVAASAARVGELTGRIAALEARSPAEPDDKAPSARQFSRLQKEAASLREKLAKTEMDLKEKNDQLKTRGKDDYARQIADLQAANERQVSVAKALQEKCDELGKARALAAEELAARDKQASASEARIQELTNKIADLEARPPAEPGDKAPSARQFSRLQKEAASLREKLAQTEMDLKEKSDQLKARGNDDYARQIADLQAANERQASVAKALQEKCDELGKARALAAEELAARDKQASASVARIEELTNKIAALEARPPAEPGDMAPSARQLRSLQQDNARLSEELAKAEIEMKEARDQHDNLAKQLKEATSSSSDDIQKRLQRQIEEKDKEVALLRAATEAFRQQAAGEATRLRQAADLQVRQAVGVQNALDRQIADLKLSDERNREAADRLQKQVAALEKERYNLQAAANETSGTLAQNERDIDKLKKELEQARKKAIADQEATLDKADDTVASALKAQDQLKNELAEVIKEKAQLEETQAKSKDREDELQRKLDDLGVTIKEKDALLKERGLDGYLKQIADLTAERDRQASEAKDLQAKYAALVNDRELLVEAMAAKDKQATASAAQVEELTAKLAAFEARPTAPVAAVDAETSFPAAAADATAVAETESLKKQVTALKDAIEQLTADAARKESAVQEAAAGLKDLDRLQQENRKLQARASQDGATIEKQRDQLVELAKSVAELKKTVQEQAHTISVTEQRQDTLKTALTQTHEDQQQSQELVAQLAENARLKAELVEAQADQKKELKQQIKTLTRADEDQRSEVAKLTRQMEKTDEALARLKTTLSEKDAVIFQRDQHVKKLSAELTARDQRIVALQAAAATPLSAKGAPPPAPQERKEIRATRGRMAANLVEQGRYREAESEYLYLLQLYPDDADVHYNLGVLYDDRLNDKPTAAIHYREYLRLKPQATDADRVKGWLLAIESKMGRQ